MRLKSLRNVLAIASLAVLARSSCEAQQGQLLPSQRVASKCEGFIRASQDLNTIFGAIRDTRESGIAGELVTLSQLATERCEALRALLILYQLMTPTPSPTRAPEFVAQRIDLYVRQFTRDIDGTNQVLAATHLPGVARQAESLRAQLRAFTELLPSLKPR